MKKILAFIIFLLFLLLLWCSQKSYQACCENNSNVVREKTVTPVTAEVKKDRPPVYEWNSGEAHTNELWEERKKEILNTMTEGKILRILGPYFKEEGEPIGITRAKSAYAKLGKDLGNKVEYGSKLVEYYDGAKTSRFGGTKFNWLTRNDNITEIDNKALIYFPTNSTKKLSNKNILDYLKDVAKTVKENGKNISLSGHTDSRGNNVANKKLAQGRANSIKAELVRMGVSLNKITAVSFGEEKPIASNDTNAGRQKNRRVELEIK